MMLFASDLRLRFHLVGIGVLQTFDLAPLGPVDQATDGMLEGILPEGRRTKSY